MKNLTEEQAERLLNRAAAMPRGNALRTPASFPTLAALALGPAAVVVPQAARKVKKPAVARGTAVKQRSEPLEADILRAIMRVLKIHPRIAFAFRANSGAMKSGDGERFMRFGFRGMSDVLGMLRDGRFLAVEVKRPSGRVTEEQKAFLDNVAEHGGIGFVARSVTDVWENLEEL